MRIRHLFGLHSSPFRFFYQEKAERQLSELLIFAAFEYFPHLDGLARDRQPHHIMSSKMNTLKNSKSRLVRFLSRARVPSLMNQKTCDDH